MTIISQTAEYALRAVVWLAGHPGTACGTPQIARATQVPTGYLSKVLQTLARAELVQSRAGRGGGFVLARPPAEISVLDVVNAVDPVERISTCPLNLTAHVTQLCPLHGRLDQAMAWVEQALAAATIAELLVAPPGAAGPTCTHLSAAEAEAPRSQPRSARLGRRPRSPRRRARA